jgi:hypothetical protein
MAAAIDSALPELPTRDEEDEQGPTLPPESGIALKSEETPEDDFMLVTLDEVELLDPASPPDLRRRPSHRRLGPRAGQRRLHSTRPTPQSHHASEMFALPTESLARSIAVLLVLTAMVVAVSAYGDFHSPNGSAGGSSARM